VTEREIEAMAPIVVEHVGLAGAPRPSRGRRCSVPFQGYSESVPSCVKAVNADLVNNSCSGITEELDIVVVVRPWIAARPEFLS